MTRILVHGVRLEARVAGDGPPLLLVHGFTGRGASWAPFLPAFRRSHRTIVVDLLGHGRSDRPADPARYSVERAADDLAKLLDTLDALTADVVGYSLGARVALRLAAVHPDAVGRLVLESASAGIDDPEERRARRERDEVLAGEIVRDGVAAFVAHWEAQPLFASQAALPPAVRDRLRAERLRNQPDGLANSLRGAGQGAMEPLGARLGDVRSPCLVIAGTLDPVGCARAADVARRLPDARLEVVPDAGHAPHLERPAVFRRLVLGFLTPAS